MAYDGNASEEKIRYFQKNMTLSDALIIIKMGWRSEDDHAAFLAAGNIISEQKDKIQSKLFEKYYSNPKHNRRKESRRKNG